MTTKASFGERAARLLGGVLVAGLSFACGGDGEEATARREGELRRVVIQHMWVKDVALAGIYYASEQGFYRDVGIEVEVRAGGPGIDPVYPVTSGDALVGIHTNASSVLIPRSRGVPLQVIATQYKQSPLGLIAKASSGIAAPRDFAGRRIGVVQTSVSVLEAVLHLNGLSMDDVELVILAPANMLPLLLEDRVDMILGFDTNQGVELHLQGVPHVFFSLDELGYRQEAYPYFVHQRTVEEDRRLLADFLAATQRGWRYALEHPREVAELSVSRYTEGMHLEKETEVAKRQASLMISETTRRHGLLAVDRRTWQATNRLLVDTGLIEEPVDLDALIVDDLLPRPAAADAG